MNDLKFQEVLVYKDFNTMPWDNRTKTIYIRSPQIIKTVSCRIRCRYFFHIRALENINVS